MWGSVCKFIMWMNEPRIRPTLHYFWCLAVLSSELLPLAHLLSSLSQAKNIHQQRPQMKIGQGSVNKIMRITEQNKIEWDQMR